MLYATELLPQEGDILLGDFLSARLRTLGAAALLSAVYLPIVVVFSM